MRILTRQLARERAKRDRLLAYIHAAILTERVDVLAAALDERDD
jgi:hypothetical protein